MFGNELPRPSRFSISKLSINIFCKMETSFPFSKFDPKYPDLELTEKNFSVGYFTISSSRQSGTLLSSAQSIAATRTILRQSEIDKNYKMNVLIKFYLLKRNSNLEKVS